MNKFKLSKKGKELLEFTIEHIESVLTKFNFLRTQVIYPGKTDEFFSIELSKIFDQIIAEFNLKNPFNDKNSEYFAFLKETALKILKMKVESDSPDSYAFCYQTEDNKIIIIIRDPGSFGITKFVFDIEKNKNNSKKLILKENIKMPSNAYTNPLFNLEI